MHLQKNVRPKVDIIKNGNHRVEPGESEEEAMETLMDESSKEQGNTGGPSVVCLTVPPVNGEGYRVLYDSGVEEDRDQILKSFKGLEYSPEDIDYVFASHTHYDHIDNNDMFEQATWYFPFNDEELYNNFNGEGIISDFYEGLKERGITYDKFDRFEPGGLQELNFPHYVKVMDTDGHQKGHYSLIIDKSGEHKPEVRNAETRDLHIPERAILTGDAIIGGDYAEEFLEGNYENAKYPASTYEGKERIIQDGKEIGSVARLLEAAEEKEETLIVPGHDPEFYLEDLENYKNN